MEENDWNNHSNEFLLGFSFAILVTFLLRPAISAMIEVCDLAQLPEPNGDHEKEKNLDPLDFEKSDWQSG